MSRTIRKKPMSKKSKGKFIDSSCKNNGDCDRCNSNRKHFDLIERTKADQKLKEYYVQDSI